MRKLIFVVLLAFSTFTMAGSKLVVGQGESCSEATSMLRHEVQRTWDNWSCRRKYLKRMQRCRKRGRRNWIRTQRIGCRR